MKRPRRNNRVASLGALLLGAIMSLVLWGCSAQKEPISIAYSPFESTALVWVAEDQGFFGDQGLDVTFRKYDTGSGALDGMLKGEANVAAGTGEFPLVARAFEKKKASVIATIDRGELIYIVGRRDRGIQDLTDLKGKRVGTTRGTIAEFFLGRSLELRGMSMQDITLVDLKTPAEWVDAVANGDVDAVSTAEPSASAARDRLGPNAIVFSAQSSQPLYALAVSTDEWIQAHPGLVHGLLEALAEAEDYALRNPAQAQTIVQKRLELNPASMEAVWSRNEFSLSLDQSLVAAMEDEARWMVKNGLTSEKETPHFLDYIAEGSLKALRPEAVHIIR